MNQLRTPAVDAGGVTTWGLCMLATFYKLGGLPAQPNNMQDENGVMLEKDGPCEFILDDWSELFLPS